MLQLKTGHMERMKLICKSATEAAHTKLVTMLHANDTEGAIEYVKTLSYASSCESKWKEMLAIAYTDGGAASGRPRDLRRLP